MANTRTSSRTLPFRLCNAVGAGGEIVVAVGGRHSQEALSVQNCDYYYYYYYYYY